MTKPMKRRKERLKDPRNFGVRLSTVNLKKLEEIMEIEGISKNTAMNFCIEAMHLYYSVSGFINEFRKAVRKLCEK